MRSIQFLVLDTSALRTGELSSLHSLKLFDERLNRLLKLLGNTRLRIEAELIGGSCPYMWRCLQTR